MCQYHANCFIKILIYVHNIPTKHLTAFTSILKTRKVILGYIEQFGKGLVKEVVELIWSGQYLHP